MFDDADAARRALAAQFEPPRLERVVEALTTAIVFAPSPGVRLAIGGTRFGGAPDMAKGAEWPRPARPPDVDEIAGRGNEKAAKEMRAHMALNLPYAFIAQIDLAEASRLEPAASALPQQGRLLFFYDIAVGPWETGARVARVIWDRTPRETLVTLAAPGDLEQAAARARQENAEIRRKSGDDPAAAEREGTNYGAPAQAVRLTQTLRLPNPHALEIDRIPELAATYRGEPGADDDEDFREAYDEALETHHDQYPGETWRRQQLLGSPVPEQSDPRYDAVVVTRFGKQHLSRGEWSDRREEIERAARDWRLLLQVDLAGWMQAEFVEGTVYFLISKDDLAARRFENVVAVYQQT